LLTPRLEHARQDVVGLGTTAPKAGAALGELEGARLAARTSLEAQAHDLPGGIGIVRFLPEQ
jgi:hypothetical protein